MGVISRISYELKIWRAQKAIDGMLKTMTKERGEDYVNAFLFECCAMEYAAHCIQKCGRMRTKADEAAHYHGCSWKQTLADNCEELREIMRKYSEKGSSMWFSYQIKKLENSVRENIRGIEIDDHYLAKTAAKKHSG